MANLQGLQKDLTASRQVYTPGRSTLSQPSTFPKTLLYLWKSCVLIQATQCIRHILDRSNASFGEGGMKEAVGGGGGSVGFVL